MFFFPLKERAWYDSHREAILQGRGVGGDGGGGEDVDVGGVDLFPFFSSTCYRGFSDGEQGFYAVYRQLFRTLCEEDQGYSDEVGGRQDRCREDVSGPARRHH